MEERLEAGVARERLLSKNPRQESGLQEAWSSELTREGMRSQLCCDHGERLASWEETVLCIMGGDGAVHHGRRRCFEKGL